MSSPKKVLVRLRSNWLRAGVSGRSIVPVATDVRARLLRSLGVPAMTGAVARAHADTLSPVLFMKHQLKAD